ncbi:sensor histidine kinase [Nakamurella sp.]|uniref:sensor histidine kinase n=1 Tax=Nakamurella sp. TaxID=1869182 RepID=UPI0037840DC0
MTTTITVLLLAVVLLGLIVMALLGGRFVRRRMLDPPGVRAAAQALRTAGLAAPPLRNGLTKESAVQALPYLRALLETPGVALCDPDGRSLGAQGPGGHHVDAVAETVRDSLRADRRQLVTLPTCDVAGCAVARAVVVPLIASGEPAGALVVLTGSAVGPYLIRAADETSRFITTQLELADLDASRADLARAEVRALRAQISPHFIYNALTTIAAFVRSDPDRARELLLEFADFTRYSFRQAGEFTTLADELGNIEKYLTLERARFGDRLRIRWRIAPEVLGVVVPFLSIQPLVENAVRHGLAGRPGGGTVSVTAEDIGPDCVISVEDDGQGMDPERVGRHDEPGADHDADHVGLGNVDDRLRAAFGEDYGLVVETAPDAGTKVIVRLPKFAPGVTALS